MQVFLVKECVKPNFWKKLLKVIEIKDDEIILNFDMSKFKFNKKVIVVNKIRDILELNESNKIILSKKLKQDRDFINLLYSKDIDIISGKILFKLLLTKLVDNICKSNKIIIKQSKISVSVNNASEINIKLIEKLAKKFKIVTNNINSFKNLQGKLLDEYGIMITITNNKKKCFLDSKIVVNIDFPEELINKYNLDDKCFLINLEENVKIHKKRFCGKVINDYNIKLKKGSKLEETLNQEIYQSFELKDLAETCVINNPDEIKNVIIFI